VYLEEQVALDRADVCLSILSDKLGDEGKTVLFSKDGTNR
jgi:hypothetical protein